MNKNTTTFNPSNRVLSRAELLARFNTRKKPSQDAIEKAAALVVTRCEAVLAPARLRA